ncbi:uncharacterized protein LOC143019562 isoform X1 [Oratosquilla oratoria]|uniref:uncharacterized protein LOC143019562 isoform X1 n=2 Tax=Oratosquilla oratoria TaxID=337810 RepID=UPI003F76BD0F
MRVCGCVTQRDADREEDNITLVPQLGSDPQNKEVEQRSTDMASVMFILVLLALYWPSGSAEPSRPDPVCEITAGGSVNPFGMGTYTVSDSTNYSMTQTDLGYDPPNAVYILLKDCHYPNRAGGLCIGALTFKNNHSVLFIKDPSLPIQVQYNGGSPEPLHFDMTHSKDQFLVWMNHTRSNYPCVFAHGSSGYEVQYCLNSVQVEIFPGSLQTSLGGLCDRPNDAHFYRDRNGNMHPRGYENQDAFSDTWKVPVENPTTGAIYSTTTASTTEAIYSTTSASTTGAIYSTTTASTMGAIDTTTSASTTGAMDTTTSASATGAMDTTTSASTTGAIDSTTSASATGAMDTTTSASTTGAIDSTTTASTTGAIYSTTTASTTGAIYSTTTASTMGAIDTTTSASTTGAMDTTTSASATGAMDTTTSARTTGAIDTTTSASTTGAIDTTTSASTTGAIDTTTSASTTGAIDTTTSASTTGAIDTTTSASTTVPFQTTTSASTTGAIDTTNPLPLET